MTSEDFQTFADNYSSEDFDRIAFHWEGGYGQDFKDRNYDFRTQLCEYLIPQLHNAKLDLIKDLYLETGKTSEYTFGCYINFHLLGQELLERGGTSFIKAYLEGAAQTMDTALTSSKISLSKRRAKELLEYFDIKMQNATEAQERKLFCDYFRHRFQREVNK